MFPTAMKGFIVFLMTVFCWTLVSSIDNDNDQAMQNPGLFEGDIVGMKGKEKRNVHVKEEKRWPGGRIPYVIDPALDSNEDKIKAAMKNYAEKTCIRFTPRNNETDYINIYPGSGCHARVGMKGGFQNVSLGPGCYRHGIIIHELGHVVGFYHEHSRSDRDDYINIHWDNVKEGAERNFEKLKPLQNLLLDKFDYDSIMLYGETVFSKDPKLGLKTMTAKKKGIVLKKTSRKSGLSKSDILRIKKMYKC